MSKAAKVMGEVAHMAKSAEIPLSLAVIGPGTVGKALLEQLRVESPRLLKNYGINLQVMSISNSREMLLSSGGTGIDLNTWSEKLLSDGADASLGVVTQHLKANGSENKVVVDCTASTFVPKNYLKWMEQNIHVVTPNKRLNSGPYNDYLAVRQLQKTNRVHYMYEGTVGAGLPIISTLKTLLG